MRPGSNHVKTNGMLSKIRHMSPKTYSRFRWFANQLKNDANFGASFAREAIWTANDLSSFKTLVAEAHKIIFENCNAGKLLLDLNLDDHAATKNTKDDVIKLCASVFDPSKDN